jgi:hypothetical protein
MGSIAKFVVALRRVAPVEAELRHEISRQILK